MKNYFFLPNKIKENRLDEIRECIGCNICVSGDMKTVPIRCTQNPTMGEEWRRDWHPETIAPAKSDKAILVVGGGPSGLECSRALSQRGYDVTLVDGRREMGGRVLLEAALPGLSEWRRVAEWRLMPFQLKPNWKLFPSSLMTAQDVLETGIQNVIIATGATYRRDGVGRTISRAVPGHDLKGVWTPDDIMSGMTLSGAVVIFDDDHYYMGGVLAELLAKSGANVTIVTSAPAVSYWTQFTLEQTRIEKSLRTLGVTLITKHTLEQIKADHVTLTCDVTGQQTRLPRDHVLLVTDRIPNNQLYKNLLPALEDGRLASLKVIGDAEAPNIIAQAVYAGHCAAREFDEIILPDATPFKVER